MLLFFALMGVVAYPRATFGLIASLGLLVLALRAPVACAATLGAIGVAIAVAGRFRSQPAPVAVALLPAPREPE